MVVSGLSRLLEIAPYDFLLSFYSIFVVLVLCNLQQIERYWSKIADFLTQLVFAAAIWGVPKTVFAGGGRTDGRTDRHSCYSERYLALPSCAMLMHDKTMWSSGFPDHLAQQLLSPKCFWRAAATPLLRVNSVKLIHSGCSHYSCPQAFRWVSFVECWLVVGSWPVLDVQSV